MGTNNTYGMKWLRFFYQCRVPIGGLMSLSGVLLGFLNGGVGVIGAILNGVCLIGYIALYEGYSKGRHLNLYASWMYTLTLVLLWGECGVAIFSYSNNVGGLMGALIVAIPFAICNHIYFYHRRYLCYGVKIKNKEIEEIEETNEREEE